MKKFTSLLLMLLCSVMGARASEWNDSQREFAADRFGIFIHWGIYSMFAQGEWYLNYGPQAQEYAKAAQGFYPAQFDAGAWADAIKDSGAKYVTFTSRHHDGFSMWHTSTGPYNIVDGTPFGRDVLKELSDSLADRGLKLHLYYSHLDWLRPDYPQGRTGHDTGRDPSQADWDSYYKFMNRQITELLTQYGPIRCMWFDGWWDHDEDKTPFDWHLQEQYDMIHQLQPACLIANNHHQNPFPGEQIQVFERDVPGENTAGYSEQDISRLPLETCQTMNGMWGYKVTDTRYKDSPTLIRYLVKTAGQGANLLLNVGPQPSGELPEQALERLRDIGKWMRVNSETIYGTEGSPFGQRSWGTATQKGNRLFVHVMTPEDTEIFLPGIQAKGAKEFVGGKKVAYTKAKTGTTLHLAKLPQETDYIVEVAM